MSKNSKNSSTKTSEGYLEVKSKLEAEYRRFTLRSEQVTLFEDFVEILKVLHHLSSHPFTLWYTDYEGDLLPINNNDNYACAIRNNLKSQRLFRLSLLRNGEVAPHHNTKSGLLNNSLASGINTLKHRRNNPPIFPKISFPEDFRRVSAIIDIDIVPETFRRVKLMKSSGSDRPLGFYIRDGVSIRETVDGMENVPGVFISRLVTGGLAESTGLLAVNDEILEVNGIEVGGKSLDQVTDMMVANSNNLIITVKPVNQHNNITPRKQQLQQHYKQQLQQQHMQQQHMQDQLQRGYGKQHLQQQQQDRHFHNHLKQQFSNTATPLKGHTPTASINSSFLQNLEEVVEEGEDENIKNSHINNGSDVNKKDIKACVTKQVEILEL